MGPRSMGKTLTVLAAAMMGGFGGGLDADVGEGGVMRTPMDARPLERRGAAHSDGRDLAELRELVRRAKPRAPNASRKSRAKRKGGG